MQMVLLLMGIRLSLIVAAYSFGMKGIRPIHLPTQPSQTTYSQIS